MGSAKLGLSSFVSLFFVSCCFVVAFVRLLGCSLAEGKFGKFGLIRVISLFVDDSKFLLFL